MVTVATDGDGILVERLPDGDDGFLSHLLLDVAVPHALAARGAVVLHGTCVADHGRAYGFLGETGMGKSTLAASFQDDGAALVADDCLVAHVDEASGTVLALPSYAALRLRAESAAALGAPGAPVVATKHLRSGRHAPSAVPLAALFLLERATPDDGSDGVEVETEVVSPARAAWEVAHRSFEASVLDERDAADAAGGVAAFVRRLRPVIERVPVVRLRYPSSFAALPEVHAAVRRWSTTAAGEGAR